MTPEPQTQPVVQPEVAKPITPPVAPQVKPETPQLIRAPRTMDFLDAMRELMNGKKIRRVSWPDPRDYGLLRNGWVSILRGDKFHTWNINDGDLEGRDWTVVQELKK